MKTWVLILLFASFLYYCGGARAQTNPSNVVLLEPDGRLTKKCGTTVRVPPLALPAPLNTSGFGVPKQLGGNCTEAMLTADGKGGATGWWCAQPEPERARLYLFAIQWEKITLPMVIDFGALLVMPDKSQRVTDMHRKYQTLNIKDMCDIWNPMVDRMNAVYPAPLPALKAWVAVGGTVFTSNGTVLTGITSKKVAANFPCLSNVAPIISIEKVYYPIVAGSTERVQCKQVAP